MAEKSPEYMALLKQLAADIAPIVADAAKAAVATASPVAAVVADPVIDAIDAKILQLIGAPMPTNAKQADTSVEARLTALENHVAALAVGTGSATSASVVTGKAALAVPVDPVAAAVKAATA